MSEDLAVDLSGVRKRYRGVEALRGADLRIRRGEIFGLLGPNGAGKSTLVKILLTLVRPTGGSGRVLGRPLGDRATLARVGYLPENLRFPEYLTARQAIDYFGSLAKVSRSQRRRRTEELLETVGMSAWADRPVRTYSKGMRQRVGLAVSLVNDPDLLVLDEPTDGVDPVGRKEIRDVLVAAAQAGRRSVLLNSHLLSEVEATCTRVAILNQGQVLAQGTIAELSGGDRRYEIEVEDAATTLEPTLVQRLESLGGRAASHEGRWRLSVPGHDAAGVQPILDALRAAGRTVVSLRPVQSSLEELFVKAVGADGGRSRPGGVLRKGVLG
ncbi:MAG: ATP-binding cassette domain-containing protein [Phycisphaerales bacterium]|jgi:ABC-2 type transport system ATP-binding protein